MATRIPLTVWLIVPVVIVIGGFMILAVVGTNSGPSPEQIAENCRKEFGHQGEKAVDDCRYEIMRASKKVDSY